MATTTEDKQSNNTAKKEETITNTENKKEDTKSVDNESNIKPKTTKKKKKKKKNKILYSDDAVKYFNGLIKNKRFNKGIDLSTGCMIFKTAWELPENNGLILPSRIIRHFKQVLPKKPKSAKKKKNKTTKNNKNNNKSTPKSKEELPRSNSMISASTVPKALLSATTDNNDKSDDVSLAEQTYERSRTMMNLQFNMNDLQNKNDEINDDEFNLKNKLLTEEERRRTMLPLNTTTATKTITATFFDNHDTPTSIDKLRNEYDEQILEEKQKKFHSKKAASFNNLQFDIDDDDDAEEQKERIKKLKENKNIGFTKKQKKHNGNDNDKNYKIDISSNKNKNNKNDKSLHVKRSSGISLTSSVTTPTNDKYIDHADIMKDDLIPDVEEKPVEMPRAETDIKHMHHEMVNFRVEILNANKQQTKTNKKSQRKSPKSNNTSKAIQIKLNGENKTNEDDTKDDDNKKEVNNTKTKPKTVKKKKKKKKNLVLYYEDATKLFKKINDGKRFKNGITLSKACKIFAVAWELPEENGRVLPSKVVRHFKHAFPSKKTAKKKSVKNNKNNKNDQNLTKARTTRALAPNGSMKTFAFNSNMAISPNMLNNGNNDKEDEYTSHAPSRSVMGNINPNQINSLILPNSNNEPKISIVSNLEQLLSQDPNRSRQSNDIEDDDGNNNKKNRKRRAASLTDLELDGISNSNKNKNNDNNHDDHDDDQIVEHEIEELIKQKKKEKEKEKEKTNNNTKNKPKITQKEKELDLLNAIDSAF